MEIIQVTKASEMTKVATHLHELATKTAGTGSVVVALSGDLGAGKTTLVQALAKDFGVSELVTSPTYVVMKNYELPDETISFKKLIHIDAYRIEDIDEMRVLGFSELLKQNNTIICIEWPERIESLIPSNAVKVTIEIDGTKRNVSIS